MNNLVLLAIVWMGSFGAGYYLAWQKRHRLGLVSEGALSAKIMELREAVEDLTLAAAEAGTTLGLVDPNAPCVDQIDEAIEKHLRYTAPVLRAHSEQEATDERR